MQGGISVEKCSKNRGFTLAELLIVVAIIGILVAISIPIFTSQTEKAKEAADLSNLRSAFSVAATNAMTTDETEVIVQTGNSMQSTGRIEKISSETCGPWNARDIVIVQNKPAVIKGVLKDGTWVWTLVDKDENGVWGAIIKPIGD